MNQRIDRRTALQLGGAATVAAVAGCSDRPGNGGDSSSEASQYSRYLGVRDNQVFFAYTDFEALEELGAGNQGGGDSGETPEFEEPMLAPAGGLFLIVLSAGFQLAAFGLGGLIQTAEESDLESRGGQILLANGALVISGELDADEIDERLTASGDQSLKTQYEQTGETGGYTLYQPADPSASGSGSSVVAVSGNTLISAQNQGAVETVIDATNGDGRATEEFDEFQWLVDNGGDGLIALGGYGPDGFDNFGDSSDGSEDGLNIAENSGGFVGSIDLDGEEMTSVLAASSEEITEGNQGQIESELQSERTDVSIDFQGDGRLVAEATYSRDVLESGGSDA
jgi:hypothetical protein